MKKVLSVIILVTLLIFAENNSASAEDYYLGVYENGSKGYLMTETIKYYRDYKGEYIVSEGYTCTVKAVTSNNIQYINYKYQASPQVVVLYRNGTMYSLRDMNKLYQNKTHPESVLISILGGIWKENMGNN